MTRRKKGDGLLIGVGLVVGAILSIAPFALLYLGCRGGPKLTKHVDDYALTHDEALQLKRSSARAAALDVEHRSHLSQGLTLTKYGEFDRRSRIGKTAYEVHAQRNQAVDECQDLQERPLSRLSETVSFVKLRDSARFAILGFIAWFAYAAMHMLSKDFGWPSAYFSASVVSLGVFAIVWLWFTIYYWASLSQLREQLQSQPV